MIRYCSYPFYSQLILHPVELQKLGHIDPPTSPCDISWLNHCCLQTFIFSMYICSLRVCFLIWTCSICVCVCVYVRECYFLRADSGDVIVPAGGQRAPAPASQRGSWSHTHLNTPSILVMEPLCFLLHSPRPSAITYINTYSTEAWSGHSSVISEDVLWCVTEQNILVLTQIKPFLTIWYRSWFLA